MPERKVGVRPRIETHGLFRVGDVDQQPVAGARAGEQVDRGIGRDVVAIPGTGGRWRRQGVGAGRAPTPASPAGVSRTPRRRQHAGEDSGARHHLGLGRVPERNLDHVEAEERVGLVRRIVTVPAPHHLGVGAGGLVSRDIDVGDVLVGRTRDQRVGVGSFAGLDVLDQPGMRGIGDVVDPHARHVIRRILDSAFRAIVAIAGPFGGDEEQVAVDRRIALRRDAGNHGDLGGRRGIAHIPDREAGEVALVDVLAVERKIGVDEREPAR